MSKQVLKGQTVYLEPTGNCARHNKKIIEAEVTEIKRKYYTAVSVENKNISYEFEIVSGCQRGSGNYYTYRSHLTPELAEESAFRNDYENEIKNGLRKLDFNVIKPLKGL